MNCRRRIISLPLTVLVTTLFGAFSNAGEVTYVDHRKGSDRFDGSTPFYAGPGVGPVRSIQAAIRRVATGGKIVLLPSDIPFTQSFVIDRREPLGVRGNPLIIEGNGNRILGGRALPPSSSTNRTAHTHRPLTVQFASGQTIESRQRPLVPWQRTVEMLGSFPPHGRFLPTERKPPLDRAAIILVGESHVTIRNLKIEGFALDGIQIRGPAYDIRVEQCEIEGNGRAGLAILTNVNAVIADSIIARNASSGIVADNIVRLELERVAHHDQPVPLDVTKTVTVTERPGEPVIPEVTPTTPPTADPLPEPEIVDPIER